MIGFGLATLVLTWPLAVSSGQAVSIRDDYSVNAWNIWWVRTALFERGTSPFSTNMLHAPVGVSLGHHALSIANAFSGAVASSWLDIDSVLRLLLFLHFWLSAWAFFLLARELTGETGGAILAGLLFSFNAYHAYYMPQLPLATMEFPPLVAFFMVRTVRRGGGFNAVGFVISVALLVASDFYYLVYTFILCALLLLALRSWSGGVTAATAVRRLALPTALSGLCVLALAWPLLSDTVSPGAAQHSGLAHAASRSNDLLGFNWFGGPERNIVSWPTMLGYTTLLLLVAGYRGVLRGRVWLLFLGLFFLLSLGPELRLDGTPTGIPLPYRILRVLPVLENLRKPDRFMVMMIFAAAVLLALAWRDASARLGGTASRRRAALGLACLALVFELSPAPILMFPVESAAYFERLADDTTVDFVVDLPAFGGDSRDARANRAQVIHGKRIPQGYVTSLALGPEHERLAREWRNALLALGGGDSGALRDLVARDGVDVIVLRKRVPGRRSRRYLHGKLVWQPFRAVRRELVALRQYGQLEESPVPPALLARRLETLRSAFGAPEYEDAEMAAFRVPPRS